MSTRGGARPGAGRKSKATKLLEAGFVCNYFGALEQEKFWKSMLASEDERIRLDAGKYLTDRLYGRPSQAMAIEHSGALDLTVLSDEELETRISQALHQMHGSHVEVNPDADR